MVNKQQLIAERASRIKKDLDDGSTDSLNAYLSDLVEDIRFKVRAVADLAPAARIPMLQYLLCNLEKMAYGK